MKDFFISYNTVDRYWAIGLAEWLVAAGYTQVMQETDFAPGSNFVLEMDKSAKLAKRTLAVLSPDYLASSFTAPEWAEAFARDPKGDHRILIPVRVRECDLDGLLAQIVYIDLFNLSPAEARERFLKGIEYAVTGMGEISKPSKYATVRRFTPDSAKQVIQGDHNIQAGRDVNIQKKQVVRNQVVREPGEITDQQAHKIKNLIDKLVEIDVLAGKPDSHGECHRRLWNRYEVTSYKKLRVEDFEDALSWLKQEVAKARPKLRRTNNQAWRNEHYKGIYAKWREMGYEKEKIYAFAQNKLELKKPVNSLKKLGEQNLKKLHDIITRMNRLRV